MIAHLIAPLISFAEKGKLPDTLIRVGIRNLLKQRLAELESPGVEAAAESFAAFLRETSMGPIACVPEKANEQHYEVPSDFFGLVLGKHRKYSCCFYDNDAMALDEAEARALQLTCEHAELKDGQEILELGCGWGSLSLWMAERYPASRILAVSNSNSQREYILSEAGRRGLTNLDVMTCDVNDLALTRQFDRVVSVEMFEHVRNHGLLMDRISRWLRPDGKLFVHIFCHNRFTYPFEVTDDSSWMAKYFFSGGIMPGRDLLLHYQKHLSINRTWTWDGRHYEKTSNAWLDRMDSQPELVEKVLKEAYGSDWLMWRQRWRMFFMSCAELFGYRDGSEWFVAHYLFGRRSD